MNLRRRVRWDGALAALVAGSCLAHPAWADDGDEESNETTVYVRGSRAPRAADEPEASVGSVSGEPLREPGVDADDVLRRVPGVQVTRSGSSADLVTASIRGAEASQIPVYLAGIRINDDIAGVGDLSRIPLWMIHRVQVYRGVTPLRVGRGGLTGAVVLSPTLPEESTYRVGAQAGSFGAGALWAGATMQHVLDDPDANWSTSLSVRSEGADNDFSFESDEGTAFFAGDDVEQTRQNADFSQTDMWALSRGRLPVGRRHASITAVYNRFDREQGVSGLSLLPALRARSEVARDLAGLSARLPCTLAQDCSLLVSSGLLSTSLSTTDPAGELSLGTSAIDQRSQRISQNAQLRLDHNHRFATTWGATVETSRILLDSPVEVLARATEHYLGALGSLLFSPRADQFVRVVARASCVEASGVDRGMGSASPTQSEWSQCQPEGRIGAFKSFSDVVSLRGTVHRGVRFPTLGERFGVSATTRGNADLAVERAYGIDLGTTFEPPSRPWGGYYLDVALFGRSTADLIAYRRSSLGYVRPFNVGTARFLGSEVSGQVDAFNHVRQRLSVSLLDPRDTTAERATTNDLIPFRSQITATEELEVYRSTPGEVLSHLGLTGYLTYRSGRVADPAGLIVIPQQFVLDVAARAQFVERVDVRARLENVFAAARYDTLGFPLPGRSFFVSAEIASR